MNPVDSRTGQQEKIQIAERNRIARSFVAIIIDLKVEHEVREMLVKRMYTGQVAA